MLRQYIPIRYTDNPDEINESGIGTLLKIAEDNKVASYNSTDNTFEMLGSLPEVTVTASKATGGPLYPFSFNKQTPAVRYDEGGGFVARGLFEGKDFMLKLFDETDKEVIDRINQEYKKKGRYERIEKTNNFLLK